MLKKMTLKIFWILLILVQTMFSQEVKNEAQKPYSIGVPSKVEHVPSIASRKNNLVRPDLSSNRLMLDGRSSRYEVVIGKGSVGDDVLAIKSKHLQKLLHPIHLNSLHLRQQQICLQKDNYIASPPQLI